MLDLTHGEDFVKIITDAVTGVEVEVTHRLPTASEEVEFQRKAFRKRGRKSVSPEDIAKNLAEIRIEYGLKIVTGFKEGDLGVDGKPISSSQESPLYFPDWKELLREKAPRILAALGMAVFEGGRVQAPEEEEEEGGEGGDPFSGS